MVCRNWGDVARTKVLYPSWRDTLKWQIWFPRYSGFQVIKLRHCSRSRWAFIIGSSDYQITDIVRRWRWIANVQYFTSCRWSHSSHWKRWVFISGDDLPSATFCAQGTQESIDRWWRWWWCPPRSCQTFLCNRDPHVWNWSSGMCPHFSAVHLFLLPLILACLFLSDYTNTGTSLRRVCPL